MTFFFLLTTPTDNKYTISTSIMSEENKNAGYLILFFHSVLRYNYHTKLESSVTNRWRNRHLTPTAQTFHSVFVLFFCKILANNVRISIINQRNKQVI